MPLTCSYSLNSIADSVGMVQEAIFYTICFLHSSQALLPTQVFITTHYKDLPKLLHPKAHKLSEEQVNEIRNWRAMYGQSVPQKQCEIREVSEPSEPSGSTVYPSFRSIKRLGVFLLLLDGMLVHHRSLPSNLLGFPPTICRYPFILLGGERHCES